MKLGMIEWMKYQYYQSPTGPNCPQSYSSVANETELSQLRQMKKPGVELSENDEMMKHLLEKDFAR